MKKTLLILSLLLPLVACSRTEQGAAVGGLGGAAISYPFSYEADEAADLSQTIERHHPDEGDAIGRWARQFLSAGGDKPADAKAFSERLSRLVARGLHRS